MGTIPIKDKASWDAEVKQSEIPVLVDFWAQWCGPCNIVSPIIDELSEDYAGKVKFVKVNIDEAGALASEHQVFQIPTFLLIKNGETIAQQSGAASKDTYKIFIEKAFA